MRHNIVLQYLFWHYVIQPRNMLAAWGNLLRFTLHYFSIPVLVRTLFAPWHRYHWSYGKFDVHAYVEIFFSNLISRIMGAFARTLAIAAGIIGEVCVFFGGIAAFLIWFLLPILLIAFLVFGIILLA